jgi:hypothetical protein
VNSPPADDANGPLPGIRQVGDTEPTSRRSQLRYLRLSLGITGAQAHALVVAYEKDVDDAIRIGNDTWRSDLGFIDWLMRQTPAGNPSMKRIRKIA